MKNKGIYKKALILAVPMMIQNGITNAVSLVDNVMVGSLGTEAITAVSIVGQLIFVFNLGIFGGLSGPGIYGAQYFGQGNTEGFRNTVRIKHMIGLFCLILGLSLFIFKGQDLISLYLKGSGSEIDPDITLKYAKEYLNIMLWGLPPFVLTQIFATSLRETGESVKPMIAGVCSVVIDVVFNYLLIYGKFSFPKLGVRGAATATVAARFVELAVILVWIFVQKHKYTFLDGLYKTLLIPKNAVSIILKKTLPIFCNEFLWAGALAALTQCYSGRGLEIVAGLNISNTICNLLNVVFVAMGSAVGIIIGQALGACEYEKAKKDSFSLMWFTGAMCIALTAILIGISAVFPNLYDTSQRVKSIATKFIIITALFFPIQGFLNALYFTLRSGGKTLVTFLFDSVYSWAVSLPLATILCTCTSLPIFAVYAIVQAADFIKVIVGYILIKKGVWISNLVEAK